MNKLLGLIGTAAGVIGAYFAYKFYKKKVNDDEASAAQEKKGESKADSDYRTLADFSNKDQIEKKKDYSANNDYPDFNYETVANYTPKQISELPSEVFKQIDLQGWDINAIPAESVPKRADSPYTNLVANTFKQSRSLIFKQLSNYRLSFDLTESAALQNFQSRLNRKLQEYVQ